MNKLIIIAMIGMIASVSSASWLSSGTKSTTNTTSETKAIDPVKQQLADACKILNVDKDYAKAQAAFQKIVDNHATTNQDYLATAQCNIGLCLARVQKYTEAQTAYAKSISDYPNATQTTKAHTAYLNAFSHQKYSEQAQLCKDAIVAYPNAGDIELATLQYGLGISLSRGKEMSNAIIELEKVKNYPLFKGNSLLFGAQSAIGDAYDYQRKFTEANTAWMLAIQTYVFELGAKEDGLIWKTFNKINPKQITNEAYKLFLEATLKAVPATEDNAKFIGKIKSELGKIK